MPKYTGKQSLELRKMLLKIELPYTIGGWAYSDWQPLNDMAKEDLFCSKAEDMQLYFKDNKFRVIFRLGRL